MSGSVGSLRARAIRTTGVLALAAVTVFNLTACDGGTGGAAGGTDWNRYYSSAETNQIMRAYARHYPELTRLYSIGTSYEGAELLVMEVTNPSTGPALEKPGFYVDGNIHSGELTGSAVTLYLMGQLLDRYGTDPQITRLVDRLVFYLRPKFNPDGADLALLHDQSLRSTVRPWDNDNDGSADEDPPEDLNDDGFITSMRIPDPEGPMRPSEEDPRVLVRRRAGEDSGPFYRVVSEGIDNDSDGRLNEDGIGGIDMNRNFPRNWALPYRQPGAGPYPLSEPETRATIEFIDSHPNITGIVHNHTSGGFVYRLPSASDPSKFDTDDLALIQELGSVYTEMTGRPVRPSATDPIRHRYGTLISWAYWDQGIIGWVPEYWPGIESDEDGDGRTSEVERMRFNDRELGGRYFVDWAPYEHPEFGAVEIGGWRSKFVSQNPPPEMLEAECALQIPWILYLAEQSPRLEADEPVIRSLGDSRFEVSITVRNTGFLPTNLTRRGIEADVIEPVVAEISMEGCRLVEGERRAVLGHLAGRYPVHAPLAVSVATARWIVESESESPTMRIVVTSEKGGTVRSGPLRLGN